jgi:putative acetyltransferase
MKIEIRPAATGDAAALSALILRAIRTTNAADYTAEEIGFVCDSFTADRVAQKIASRHVFMLFADAALAGTASYAAGTIHSLFIDPGHQAKGFGALMLAHVERHARAQRARWLKLSSSVTAKGFYEAFGYSHVEDEFSNGGITHLMRKRL